MNYQGDNSDTGAVEVLALAGSFRTGSLNQALLGAAQQLAPAQMSITDIDLRQVPFYDGDLEKTGDPNVADLRERVESADALLIVTPEYNGGLPAVLKNAIDWASRGYPHSPIGDKIVAIMGASPGRSGTARAQDHLRQILARVGAKVIESPTVEIGRAGEVIADSRLADGEASDQIADLLEALYEAVCLRRDCGSLSAIA